MRMGLILPRGLFVAKNQHMARFMESHPEVFRPWMIPSLGLLTIAALTPEVEAEYIDENFQAIDFDRSYDIVALSGMTQQAYRAYEISGEFRRRGVYTVMGGPHATVLPEEVLKHVDTVIVGEAEGIWEVFMADFQRRAPKREYRNSVPGRLPLGRVPVARYDVLGKDYFSSGHGYKMIPVQTTRGCPRTCDFCSVPQAYGKSFRKKTVAQVVAEVEAAKEAGRGPLIIFTDDNMFIDRRFSYALLQALIPLKIRYMAQSDIGIATDEKLLKLIYESGCVMALVGLESLSFENLKQVDRFKARMLSGYGEYVDRIQANGITVLGGFMVGFDHDDPGTFERIADFVLKHRIWPQLTVVTPLPKTRLFERLRKEGRLLEETYWDKCTYYDAVFEPKGMSKEQLEEGLTALHERLFCPEAMAERRWQMRRNLKGLRRR